MPSSKSPIKWPIMGIWKIEGHQAHLGILSVEDDKVYLKIFLELSNSNQLFANALETHPTLAPFQPPNQPTVFGETKTAGKVTLLKCAQFKAEVTHQIDPPVSRVEITLLVTQAWAGAEFVEGTAIYKELSFAAPGLHSVLSASSLESKWLVRSTRKLKSDTHRLKTLTGADQIFLFSHGHEPSAVIKNHGKTYKIAFSTSVGQSSSSTEGVTFGTTDSVRIETPGATLSELMNVAYQVEQFLSLLCVGPFRGERVDVTIDQFRKAELIWSLGREPRYPKHLPECLTKYWPPLAAIRRLPHPRYPHGSELPVAEGWQDGSFLTRYSKILRQRRSFWPLPKLGRFWEEIKAVQFSTIKSNIKKRVRLRELFLKLTWTRKLQIVFISWFDQAIAKVLVICYGQLLAKYRRLLYRRCVRTLTISSRRL